MAIDTAILDEFLLGVNGIRQKPVAFNGAVIGAAQMWAEKMAASIGLVHDDVQADLDSFGYSCSSCGECIAEETLTIGDTLNAWLADPPHAEIIKDERYTECGIGESGGYWCAIFATR